LDVIHFRLNAMQGMFERIAGEIPEAEDPAARRAVMTAR
jgi:hypothetical protein